MIGLGYVIPFCPNSMNVCGLNPKRASVSSMKTSGFGNPLNSEAVARV